jgi:hypothetical protein
MAILLLAGDGAAIAAIERRGSVIWTGRRSANRSLCWRM